MNTARKKSLKVKENFLIDVIVNTQKSIKLKNIVKQNDEWMK